MLPFNVPQAPQHQRKKAKSMTRGKMKKYMRVFKVSFYRNPSNIDSIQYFQNETYLYLS